MNIITSKSVYFLQSFNNFFVVQSCPLCRVNSPQVESLANSNVNGIISVFSRCSVCHSCFICEYSQESHNKKSTIIITYPNSKSDCYKYLEYCPEVLKLDFEEMLKTFDVQCYKSSIVMARRTMQIIARDTLVRENLTADKDTLAKELLKLKENGIILRKTYDMYTKTRKLGNNGAHPDEDETLNDITQNDAQMCIDCVVLFIKEIYEVDELYKKIEANPKAN